MNVIRRIPRLLVKASAAGALLVAGTLPLVAVDAASAATPATLSSTLGVGAAIAATTVGNLTGTGTSGANALTLSSDFAGNVTFPANSIVSGTGVPTGDYITAAVTTANYATASPGPANPASAAVNLAYPLTATASGTYTLTTGNSIPTFGSGGGSTSIYVYGSGFADNGSTVTFSTNATGVTFSSATEETTSIAKATLTTGATTATGFYNLTVADGNGTSAPLANAYQVSTAPVVTSVSPSTLVAGTTSNNLTLTGTGFVDGMTVVLTSTVDGTLLTSSTGVTATSVTATSANVSINAQNPAAASPHTPTAGTYTVTVTNPDGGTSTSSGLVTVTAYGLTSSSPSYIPLTGSGGAASTTTVTISGTNLGTGGVLELGTNGGSATAEDTWLGVPTITNSSITVSVTEPGNTTATALLDFTFTNSSGVQSQLLGALGIGTASTNAGNAPTVTSVGNVGTLGVGSAATLVVNGTNFVPGSTSVGDFTFYPTGTSTVNPGLACASVNVVSTSQGTCTISSISATTVAGGQDVYATFGGQTSSSPLTNALTIAGPVITSVSPSVLGIGAGNGTTLTLTGTGFTTTGTTDAVFTGVTGSPTIAATVTSATSATVTLNANVSASKVTITLTHTGVTTSPAFTMVAGTALTVGTGFVYPGTTGGVGQGASDVLVTIPGSGFLTGATVSFGSSSGLSATVVSVTSTSIVAKVSATSDASTTTANNLVTVTNPNGGTGTSSTGMIVVAGPGTLSATPSAAALAGKTSTLTLSGTNFETGVVVTSSSSLLTVGTVVRNSATSLTVPVTASALSGTNSINTTLTVTNPDGGVSTLTVKLNPGPTVTGVYYVAPSSSNVEVSVAGTGFESTMTASSSNAAFKVTMGQVIAAVSPSITTTAILVVSTDSTAIAGTSSTITLTNPDGGTVNFTLNGGTPPVVTPPVVTPPAKGFSLGKVHGAGVHGHIVNVTMVGTGFYGAPKITSNAPGTRCFVTHDTGSLITIRLISGIHAAGWHTFTVTLANGKSAKRNYFTR